MNRMDNKTKLQEAYKALDQRIKAISKSILDQHPYVGTELDKRILVAKEMKRVIEMEILQMEQMQIQEKIKDYVQ